jgi:hypothetical protein
VAKVTVTRVNDQADRFLSFQSGAGEVPAVATRAEGRAVFELDSNNQSLHFGLAAWRIDNVTQAHIHAGLPNENGPVVAFLYGPAAPSGPIRGPLSNGMLTEADLVGPFAGDFAGFVQALKAGELYVNLHTSDWPSGEVRGQIGAGN